MFEPTAAILSASVPIVPISWGVLVASLLITVAWLAHLYR